MVNNDILFLHQQACLFGFKHFDIHDEIVLGQTPFFK